MKRQQALRSKLIGYGSGQQCRWWRTSTGLGPFVGVFIALFLFVLIYPALAANDYAEKSLQHKKLQQTIDDLRSKLEKARGKQSTLRAQLRPIEKEIGQLNSSLKQLGKELKSERDELDRLQIEKSHQKSGIVTQRKELEQLVRSNYALGRQGQLKFLLNQEDPSAVSRTLIYYEYFNKARAEKIAEINARLTELSLLEELITKKVESIEVLYQSQKSKKERLSKRSEERRLLLARLDAEVRDKGRLLEELKADEKQLGELLAGLRRALADIPKEKGERKPFVSLKGRMALPAKGKVSVRFGRLRDAESGLKWRGIIIDAKEGHDVKAIAHGRVVFSDWLRGYGLLLIIDHGDGYMSLYGYNQALYSDVGDWVEKGEVIAGVGLSGGRSKAGLYFEVRKQGEPVNPLLWCKK